MKTSQTKTIIIIIVIVLSNSLFNQSITAQKKYGYIDTIGNYIIEPIYDELGNLYNDYIYHIQFQNPQGLTFARINDKWGIVDVNGNEVIKPISLERINMDELIQVKMQFKYEKKDFKKYCFMDKNGNFPIKAIFDNTGWFKYGLAPARVYPNIDSNYTPVFKDVSFVNYEGDTVTEKWDVSTFLYKIEKQNLFSGRVGYIDLNGNVVINPQFIVAKNFSEGLAAIRIDDKLGFQRWGFIDTEGNPIDTILYSKNEVFNSLYEDCKEP